MNAPRTNEYDYIDFLIATPHSYSCMEAARVQPEAADKPAHDSITRLLHRLEPSADELWREAEGQVEKRRGMLILDDSTLDKPYARQMGLVTRHWSGKHRRVVQGINLITLMWTDGDRHIPCDYRIYDKSNDGLSKNDHFRAMVTQAAQRGFEPTYTLFDSWYSGLDNLKRIGRLGWRWFTQLKGNRSVDLDRQGQRQLATVEISAGGTIVYLKGYGLIKVFKIVAPDGDIEFWATNHLEMDELTRLRLSENAAMIETYHRGIKQFCGLERAQVRIGRAMRNHIGLVLRAFLRIEHYCFYSGCSWFEAKLRIVRNAVTAYLAAPFYHLPSSTA